MNEIFLSEDAKRICGVEAERLSGGPRRLAGGRRRGRELAQDPAVELSLCGREPTRARETLAFGANIRRSERVEGAGVAFDSHSRTLLASSFTTYAR